LPRDLGRCHHRQVKDPTDGFLAAASLDCALAACVAAAGTWTDLDAERWWEWHRTTRRERMLAALQHGSRNDLFSPPEVLMTAKESHRPGRVVAIIAMALAPAYVVVHGALFVGEPGSAGPVAYGVTFALTTILSALTWAGHAWARWLLAVMMLAVGAIFGVAGLLGLLINPGLMPFEGVVSGVLLIAAATVLTFSESVFEYLDRRSPADASREWDRAGSGSSGRVVHAHASAETLLKRASGRHRVARVATGVMVGALSLTAVIFAAFVADTFRTISPTIASVPSEAAEAAGRALEDNANLGGVVVALGTAVGSVMAGFVLGLLFVELTCVAYVAFFVLPFLLTLPVTGPLATSWKAPARFLLLRPFNRAWATPPLRAFVRRSVAPFGHCYTLADSRIQVPLHVRIPWLLGGLSLFSFRARMLRRGRQLQALVDAMHWTTIRNLNWCFAHGKIFPVACIDAGWRACVRRLVEEADVILVDVGDITPNVAWELALLRDRNALARSVFIAHERQAAAAAVSLAAQIGGHAHGATLLTYGDRPRSDVRKERAAIAACLAGEQTTSPDA
jgi:hypothetical protein